MAIWGGRLAHMQSGSVVVPEGGGDARPAFEGPAEGGPTDVVAGLAQAGADHLYGLVGDDGDEWMAPGWAGLR